MFADINPYIYWEFSDYLRKVLEYKETSITTLYELLQDLGYVIEIESLRRYFNPNDCSSRFPPKSFVNVFCRCLQLTHEQEEILLLLWTRMKVIRKINKKMKQGKLNL
ncbi:MAG: hypothetical protein C4288_14925 [Leptolyngbya sp. ERB_1_1]